MMPLSQTLHGQTRRARSTYLHGLLWALFAVGLWGADAPMFAGQSPDAPAPPVVVAEVTLRTVPIYEEFVARTQAMHTVELRARMEGFLEQVRFQEDALVHAGQLLFVIEQPPDDAALQLAKAQLAQAQANLIQAQEQVDVPRARAQLPQQRASLAKARQDVARLHPLARDRAVSQQDLDIAVAAAEVQARGMWRARISSRCSPPCRPSTPTVGGPAAL
jgi:multidrug efflux pump subunit AcrA (membrane-fusion protein)